MNYCFFAAALPTITPGALPPFSVAEFDAMAQEELSASDFAKMISWDDAGNKKIPAVYQEMRRFDAFLSWRIAQLRAERAGVAQEFTEPDENYSEIDFVMPSAASSTVPAEREEMIDMLRWKKMDELEVCHDFDVTHFCIYRLRLLAMEKFLHRAANDGRTVFGQLVDKLDPAQMKQ